MLEDVLRKIGIATLLTVIVGGLWVIASYRSKLEHPEPMTLAWPDLPRLFVEHEPLHSSRGVIIPVSAESQRRAPSFNQILLEDDQVVSMG